MNAPTSLHSAFAWNPKDQSEFQRRYTDFIRAYAVRYGKNLDGWWFDGCYTWDVFPNHTYRWPLWFDAARAGNPEAIVAFNDGSFCTGTTKAVTPLEDYLSGEVDLLIDGKIRLGRQPERTAVLAEIPVRGRNGLPMARPGAHRLHVDARWPRTDTAAEVFRQ